MSETKLEKLQFDGALGKIPAILFTPGQESTKFAVVLPGAGYSYREPLLQFAIKVMVAQGHQVLALDKIYADDPMWANLTSEAAARKVVEDDANAIFPQISARFTKQPDVLFGRSLGAYAMACVLERSLIQPRKIVWQTPALRDKWNVIRECDVPGFAVIGTGDSRFSECLPFLPKDKIVIEGADHGMEIPGDPIRSIEILKQVTEAMDKWIRSS